MKPLNDILKAKFTAFYNFIDIKATGSIKDTDINAFHQRILDFTGWEENCLQSACLKECLGEFVKACQDIGEDISLKLPISLDMMMSAFLRETDGCKSVQHLPLWLQLFPKLLFDIIDRNRDCVIFEDELANFYQQLIDPEMKATDINKAYAEMTDNSSYAFDRDLFEQIFCNFLLCRNFHGPGKYLFGCFKESTCAKPEEFKVKLQKHDSEDHEDEATVVSPNSRKKFYVLPRARIEWMNVNES